MSGLVGAFIGAVASYFGSMRAAHRANAVAWAANTVTVAQALLDSDDPAKREAGDRLLAASVRAIADSGDTPGRIRQVTRSGDLAQAIDQVRSIEADGGAQADIELAEEGSDDHEGAGDPQASRRRES